MAQGGFKGAVGLFSSLLTFRATPFSVGLCEPGISPILLFSR